MSHLAYITLQQRITESDLGRELFNAPLINQDVWPLETLGYSDEELRIQGSRNIYFRDFRLAWLKLLTKLTIKATAREKRSLNTIIQRITYLKQLDEFLFSRGYGQPELITDALLQEFVNEGGKGNRQATIVYAAKLWAEEGWLKFLYTPPKYKESTPKIETIPEEVLYQIFLKFDLFPAPLERLFRLQLVLGCRIGEMLRMPRQCLKQEGDQWYILRWIEKRKYWKFYQIHPIVAELVREQQKFLDTQFGRNSDFDKLFCKVSTACPDIFRRGKRFEVEPFYFPELLSNSIIYDWLLDFSEKADLKDKYGNRFRLTSHHFRRTKFSIMAYCETEDEYIAAVAGHGSLDMLPHYRQRSLERLEKEASEKGYVDMYGRITTFKPKKIRTERLDELLKVSMPQGECHKPTMLGECESRYACLSCDHHRVKEEDKPKIEADIKNLEQDLEQAQAVGQKRRVTEINRLLGLLKTRLQGLEKLENLREDDNNGIQT